MRAAHVVRPNAGGETEAGGVGLLDRLVLVVENVDGEHRAEHLVLGDRHLGGDAVEDRGREEQSARAAVVGAGDDRGAVGQRTVDVPAYRRELLGVGQRPHLAGGIQRVAEHDRARPVDELRDQFVLDVAVDEQPRARDAGLPGGGEDSGDHAVRGRPSSVGVGEHHVGRLAAELQGDAREWLAGSLRDPCRPSVEPVNATLSMPGCGRAPPASGPAGDDIEHAGGKPGLSKQPSELEGG